MSGLEWPLACPQCRRTLGSTGAPQDHLQCPDCPCSLRRRQGIWQAFAPGREQRYRTFLRDYTRIRKAEGRGTDSPDYYLGLPQCPPQHPIAWQWKIRRATYRTLQRRVLPRLAPASRMLDLGAGVGWLSYRLAQQGLSPCAVDLSDDPQDGLAAARHYRPGWPRVRSEFDRLPFPECCADAALFNASLHYSTDYRRTLLESLRVVRGGGWLIVLETPVYRRESSGRQMAARRHADFQERFGTPSDALASMEFLTWDWIGDLGRDLGLKWRVLRPFYGLKWHLRPLKALLRGTREPSQFVILASRVP